MEKQWLAWPSTLLLVCRHICICTGSYLPRTESVVVYGYTNNYKLILTAGINNLIADDKKYAILVSDTVVVTSGGGPPDVSTALALKDWKDVAYFLHDERETESPALENDDIVPDDTNLPVRKSSRTEQVDFKAREEER